MISWFAANSWGRRGGGVLQQTLDPNYRVIERMDPRVLIESVFRHGARRRQRVLRLLVLPGAQPWQTGERGGEGFPSG